MSECTPTRNEMLTALVIYRAIQGEEPPRIGDLATPEQAKRYRGEAERGLAEVERAAAARALEEAVIDFESGEVTDQDIKYSTSAPKGWSDACVHDAIVASGPIMDWLRARAAEIREENRK